MRGLKQALKRWGTTTVALPDCPIWSKFQLHRPVPCPEGIWLIWQMKIRRRSNCRPTQAQSTPLRRFETRNPDHSWASLCHMRLVSGLPRQVERTGKTVAARGIRRVVNVRPSAYPRTPPKAADVLLHCSIPLPVITPLGLGLDVGYDIAVPPPNGTRADSDRLREHPFLLVPVDRGTAEASHFFNLLASDQSIFHWTLLDAKVTVC